MQRVSWKHGRFSCLLTTAVVRSNRRCFSAAATQCEALNILFCGSDEYSIPSLRALHNLQQSPDSNVGLVEVVCRPDKRVGRGLKKIHQGQPIHFVLSNDRG